MKSLPVSRRTLFTVAAFLVAPLVAAFGLSLANAVRAGSPQFKVVEVLVWTFIFYFYAAWATVLLGLPSFLVLRKLGAVRWWSAAIVGSVVGVLVLAFIDPRGLSVVAHQGTVLWGGVGAVSAFTFWLIWTQGQDSRPSGT
jgi:hypothetical protein